MGSFIQIHPSVVYFAAFTIFFFFLYKILYKKKTSAKTRVAPEPAGAWPFIGHLPLLSQQNLPHITLGDLADKYGPAFTVQLGLHKAIVVSSWEVAKECFTVNDKVLATRPTSVAVKIMCYNYAVFGFGPYGSYWREARKIVVQELLSNHRLNLLKHVLVTEISMSMNELYTVWQKNANNVSGKALVEMKQWFGDLSLNVIVKLVAGKRYFQASAKSDDGERDQLKRGVKDLFHMVGLFLVSDALPFLSWLDIGGHEKAMRRTAKELDNIMGSWLDEHKQAKLGGVTKGEQDFMDVLMSILEDNNNLPEYEPDVVSKAICLGMILGGADTTTITLTWIVSLLLNNRHILEKAREEIDSKVGKDRQVSESDIEKLVYLQAIVKETLRLYPPAPLSTQHEAMEDCTIAGYHVQAGTRLITNIWKIQRDPGVWPNPCEFQPERFLTTHANVDSKGKHFEFIPFGSGRRACPGMSLGLQVVHLTLARLLQGFELETQMSVAVDMTESAGLTNLKVTPLDVLINPRLPANLY